MQHRQPSRPREAGNTLPAVSFLLRLLAVLSFALAPMAAEAMPMHGNGAGQSAGGLVAICSDDGVRYVRIEGWGDEDVPASDDCSCIACFCCLNTTPDPTGSQAPGGFAVLDGTHPLQFIAFMADTLPVAAEQFWASLRGPPDPKEEKSMTTMHARNAARTACLAGYDGSISCL